MAQRSVVATEEVRQPVRPSASGPRACRQVLPSLFSRHSWSFAPALLRLIESSATRTVSTSIERHFLRSCGDIRLYTQMSPRSVLSQKFLR